MGHGIIVAAVLTAGFGVSGWRFARHDKDGKAALCWALAIAAFAAGSIR